jgi:hypothetical protein
MSTEQELLALKKEFEAFKTATQSDLFTLQKNQSSRRGMDGSRGEKGDRGDRGTDGKNAVLIIKKDDEKNVVNVFDERQNVVATIVSVPGKNGVDGAPGVCVCKNGRDGVSPSISEIVQAVIQEFKTRWARL